MRVTLVSCTSKRTNACQVCLTAIFCHSYVGEMPLECKWCQSSATEERKLLLSTNPKNFKSSTVFWNFAPWTWAPCHSSASNALKCDRGMKIASECKCKECTMLLKFYHPWIWVRCHSNASDASRVWLRNFTIPELMWVSCHWVRLRIDLLSLQRECKWMHLFRPWWHSSASDASRKCPKEFCYSNASVKQWSLSSY